MTEEILAAIAQLGADLRGDIVKLGTDLLAKINAGNERIMNRLTALEGEVRNLRSEHSVTRDLVASLPATVLGAIEKPLLQRLTAVETRVTKLEGDRPQEGG